MPIVQVNIIANGGEVNRNEMRDKVATPLGPFLFEIWPNIEKDLSVNKQQNIHHGMKFVQLSRKER